MHTDIKPVKVEFDSKGYSDLVSKIEDLEHRAVSQNKSLKHIETALRGSFRFHNDNVLDVRRPFELIVEKRSLPGLSEQDNRKICLIIKYLD